MNIGQLINIATMIFLAFGAYYAVKQNVAVMATRFDDFKDSIDQTVRDLSSRLDRHETTMFNVVGDLQKVIGRIDAQTERRINPR